MRVLAICLGAMIAACVGDAPGIEGTGGELPSGDEEGGGGGGGGGDGSGSGSGMGSGSGSGSGGGGPAGRIRINGKNLVDANGAVVRLTGVNWFGFETDTFVPHGLWARSMDSVLDQVKMAGFNTLRIPFSTALLDAANAPNGFDAQLNPDLVGKTGLQVLDILITKAGARDLRVILDRHRPDQDGQSALWYTAAVPESKWIADWVMLAQRYRNNPTVVALDLHNEPHAEATWGDGNLATDWRLAAQRAGNAILAVHPEALVIVEGVEVQANNYYWWGGNLRGAATAPVQLSSPNHVIYSPHEYPSSIYAQPWFAAANYPANLPALWDATWGHLASSAPVLVGEFGTKLETESDKQWLSALVQYMRTKEMSFTYWSLNPNSGDTGGILADDWTTLRQDKLSYLTPALAPRLPVQ